MIIQRKNIYWNYSSTKNYSYFRGSSGADAYYRFFEDFKNLKQRIPENGIDWKRFTDAIHREAKKPRDYQKEKKLFKNIRRQIGKMPKLKKNKGEIIKSSVYKNIEGYDSSNESDAKYSDQDNYESDQDNYESAYNYDSSESSESSNEDEKQEVVVIKIKKSKSERIQIKKEIENKKRISNQIKLLVDQGKEANYDVISEEKKLWELIDEIKIRDIDERVTNFDKLRILTRSDRKNILREFFRLSGTLVSLLSNDKFKRLSNCDKYNFLFHVIGKGESFYKFVLEEPSVAEYLLHNNNFHKVFYLIFKIDNEANITGDFYLSRLVDEIKFYI